MNKYNKFKNLVLSGGGLLGFSYIGLLRYLEENNLLSQIKSISGSSVGAIFATLFIIGCKSDELQNFYTNIVIKDYVKLNAESFINFSKLKGLENGNGIMSVFNKFLLKKTGNQNITFLELYKKFNITLQVGVTNLTKYKFEIFNHINKPNIPVNLAVRASIAMPLILEPIVIDGDLYCDGGLIENLPIETINDLLLSIPNEIKSENESSINLENTNENETENETDIDKYSKMETLGVCLINTINNIDGSNYQSATLSHYFSVIMHTLSMTYFQKKKALETNQKYKLILYEIPCDIMTFIKINASVSDLVNIVDIAYNITKKELD